MAKILFRRRIMFPLELIFFIKLNSILIKKNLLHKTIIINGRTFVDQRFKVGSCKSREWCPIYISPTI